MDAVLLKIVHGYNVSGSGSVSGNEVTVTVSAPAAESVLAAAAAAAEAASASTRSSYLRLGLRFSVESGEEIWLVGVAVVPG